MSNVPIPPADDGYPIVQSAVDALRDFAGPQVDRAAAALLLPAWVHARELSDREYRGVLRRFPLPADTPPGSWLHLPDATGWSSGDPTPEGVDGRPLGARYARCQHCGQDVPIVGGRFAVHTRPVEGDHCRDSGRPLHR